MNKTNTIKHEGVITKLSNGIASVNFVTQSACASCQAKGACHVSEMKDASIDIPTDISFYELGEKVNINMEKSEGLKAVLYAYFLPFLVLLLTLIVSIQITQNEALSGVLSLSILIPYYIILHLNKQKLEKQFTFRIQKL